MASSDILRQMINDAPDQVANINNSIGQIENLIDDLDEQIDALTNGMCAPAEAALTDYLDNTKLPEIEALYGTPFNTPFYVDYGPDYGTIDYTTGGISDWSIKDSSGNIEYSLTVNWDSDTTISKPIDDYDFANNYLTRPLTSIDDPC